MQRTKWIDRTFTFNAPEGWMPNILERLHGTHARLVHLTSGLTKEQLTFKPGGKWSVQEHIGHLADLEEVHEGRIDDFVARKAMLRAADMQNLKTEKANHNAADLQELLHEFEHARTRLTGRLRNLDDATCFHKSMHPRLKTFMRPVDLAFFTAEHDDHHLASMRAIIVGFG